MRVSEFDYELPTKLIAQEPLSPRDTSRLLVLNRKDTSVTEYTFKKILDFIEPQDALVLNDTRVIPARLFGKKLSGAKIEFLLLKELLPGVWEVLVKPAKRLKESSCVIFGKQEFKAQVLEKTPKGTQIVKFSPPDVKRLMTAYGVMPTPSYIKKELKNDTSYQTVYARVDGAIAAPTAGFHFTPHLLDRLLSKGVNIVYITLHVGLATFRPIKVADIEEHKMDEESFIITNETARLINHTKSCGKRIFAVGTTVTRALESSVILKDRVWYLKGGKAKTDLFIWPPYQFKIVDCLLTNFHLPRSTNFVLACAFAGIDFVKRAYRYAIERRFRFYSFGDAMLIL